MANTYTQLYIQLVFVVENRQCLIANLKKDEIYKYITGIIQEKGNKLIIINGMPDHIHILLGLNPKESISDLVKEIKRCSSNFINERNLVVGRFNWQKGYAAFSYSKSSLDDVIKYIKNQEEHHKKRTFQEEYIGLLQKFNIEYNERFLFKVVE